MSTGVLVSVLDLRECFSDLKPLFSKGDKTLPILLKIKQRTLTVCCTAGCTYVNKMDVVNDANATSELTILYRDLLEFLPKIGQVEIEFNSYGVRLKCTDTVITLPVGYSLITEPTRKDVQFVPVESFGYSKGLLDLLNINLASLYKKEKPVNIYGALSVLKYPNVLMQVRTPGLPISVSLTPDFVKLFIKFRPEEVYSNNVDSVILKRSTAFLEIPAEPLRDTNNFTHVLEGLGNPIRVDIEHYCDKLRSMSSLGNNLQASLTLHENGLRCRVEHDNISIAVDLGDCSSDVAYVCKLPFNLFFNMMKVMGNSYIEILYGEQKLCLRNQATIIVAHVII